MAALVSKTNTRGTAPYLSWSVSAQIHLVASFAVLAVVAMSNAVVQSLSIFPGTDAAGPPPIVRLLLVLTCVTYPSIAFALPAKKAQERLTSRRIVSMVLRYLFGFSCSLMLLGAGYMLLNSLPIAGHSPDTLSRALLLAISLQLPAIAMAVPLAVVSQIPKETRSIVGRMQYRLAWKTSALPAVFFLTLILLLSIVFDPFSAVLGFLATAPWVYEFADRRICASDPSLNVLVIRLCGVTVTVDGNGWIYQIVQFTVCCVPLVPCALVGAAVFQYALAATDGKARAYLFVVLGFVSGSFSLLFMHSSMTSRKDSSATLMRIWGHLRILRILGYTPDQGAFSGLDGFLRRIQTVSGGYCECCSCSYFPLMGPTFLAVMCQQALSKPKTEAVRISHWIVSCRHADGGFGLWPGAHSRFLSTYWALTALGTLGHELTEHERDATAGWIVSHYRHGARFVGPYSRRSAIEETFHAVASLGILKRLELLGDRFTAQDIKGFLGKANSTAENIEDICHAIAILHTVGELDATTRQMATKRFVFPLVPLVNRLPLHSNLATVAWFVELAKRVLPGGTDQLLVLLPELADRAASSLDETILSSCMHAR